MSATPARPRAMLSSVFESMTVQVRAGLGEGRLLSAVRVLLDRHAALRGGAAATTSCLRRVSVAGLDGAELARRADDEVAAAAVRLGPSRLQAVWLDAGPGQSGKLLLVIHPDVLASVPWHVLLSDLASAWKTCTEVGGMALRHWVPLPVNPRDYAKAR